MFIEKPRASRPQTLREDFLDQLRKNIEQETFKQQGHALRASIKRQIQRKELL